VQDLNVFEKGIVLFVKTKTGNKLCQIYRYDDKTWKTMDYAGFIIIPRTGCGLLKHLTPISRSPLANLCPFQRVSNFIDFSVQNLNENSQYSIQIRSENEIDQSKWSKSVIFRTNSINASFPQQIKEIQCIPNITSLRLKWKIPNDSGAEILKFQVISCLS
jgi:hypothetical protein